MKRENLKETTDKTQSIIKSINTANEILEIMKDVDFKIDIADCPNLYDTLLENEESDKLIDSLSMKSDFIVSPTQKEEDINKLLARLNCSKKRNNYRTLKFASSIVAAAVIVLSFLVSSLLKSTQEPKIINFVSESAIVRPTLILSNGKNLNLNQKGPVEISNYISEQKEIVSSKDTLCVEEVEYNTIKIPHNYSLSVMLTDGTKVFLNANSELKYPVKFSDANREVFLKGEGYFEVTKNGNPFVVITEDITVKAYGTKFSVNSNIQDRVETTLLSGSIGVTNNVLSSKEMMITPGHQYTLNKLTSEVVVKEINSEIAVQWLDGYLTCYNEPISVLFEKLSVWYGVKFIVDGDIDIKKEAIISLKRDLSVDDLLDIIEDTIGLIFIKEESGVYSIKQLK